MTLTDDMRRAVKATHRREVEAHLNDPGRTRWLIVQLNLLDLIDEKSLAVTASWREMRVTFRRVLRCRFYGINERRAARAAAVACFIQERRLRHCVTREAA